jgi:hypothetical protein
MITSQAMYTAKNSKFLSATHSHVNPSIDISGSCSINMCTSQRAMGSHVHHERLQCWHRNNECSHSQKSMQREEGNSATNGMRPMRDVCLNKRRKPNGGSICKMAHVQGQRKITVLNISDRYLNSFSTP